MNSRLHQVLDNPDWAQEVNWRAAALAKKCNVSSRTLERFIRKETGKSPHAWIAEHRQKKAMELLRDGSSVKETAGCLGFKHATHFSREFKFFWGICPTAEPLQKASSKKLSRILV